MPRLKKTVELGIKDLRAGVGDHVAYFWETESEFVEAVRFLDRGIRDGEHAVVFGHDEANDRVLAVLRDLGGDVEELRSAEQLTVLGAETTGELMLSRIGAAFQKAIDAGAPLIRLLGNIGWSHSEWPDETDILRFEAKVTTAAASFPCVVICMYDIKTLSGPAVFHGAFGTHPLTIYNNLIRENPVCTSVDEYLERLERRASA